MKQHNVQLIPCSKNAKTGPIPVSTSSADTCPTACPFNHMNQGGCYAETGPISWNWKKVTNGSRGTSYADFLEKVRMIPAGQLWRHNAAGDLQGDQTFIDAQSLVDLTRANGESMGFTYTHYPMFGDLMRTNRALIEYANHFGFTINLSANSLMHADDLADLDIAPVVVVVDKDQTENMMTPQARRVVICPATQSDTVTCATCKLCARPAGQGRPIIAFPAHGARKNAASSIANINIVSA